MNFESFSLKIKPWNLAIYQASHNFFCCAVSLDLFKSKRDIYQHLMSSSCSLTLSPISYHFNSIFLFLCLLLVQASQSSYVLCIHISSRRRFRSIRFVLCCFLFAKLKQFAAKHVNGRMYGIKMRSQGRCCVIGRYCRGLL